MEISSMNDYKKRIDDVKSGLTKMSMTDDEMKKALNVPPRDATEYPMLDKEKQIEAADFIYKLNLMASSEVDGNLQSLVWELYYNMNEFLHKSVEGSSINLAMTLERLKSYLVSSNNPILATPLSSTSDVQS